MHFISVLNSSQCDPRVEIYCSEGRCLPAKSVQSVRCDHYIDCLHGEDEESCGTIYIIIQMAILIRS